MSCGNYSCRSVETEIVREIIGREGDTMLGVENEQFWTEASESSLISGGNIRYRGNYCCFRPFPWKQWEDEGKPLFSLIPERLPESHTLGKCCFDGCVSYFYYQIRHGCKCLKPVNLRIIIEASSKFCTLSPSKSPFSLSVSICSPPAWLRTSDAVLTFP